MAPLNPASAEEQSDLGARAAKGALWSSAASWGEQLVQLVVFVTLARLLGPEAFGLVGIALIVTSIGMLVIHRGGWAEAVIQEHDPDPAYLDAVFWALAILSIALFAAAWATAGPVAVWFEVPEVEQILPWLALILPIKALGIVPGALLRRKMRYRALAIRSMVAAVLGGTAGIICALLGAGAWSLVINHVGQLVSESVVLWLASAWRPGWGLSRRRLSQVVTYASGVFCAQALEVADELIGRSFVARVIGVVQVGHYSVARRFLVLVQQLLLAPPSHVAMPVFSQIGRHRGNLQEPLRLGMQITALITFPGCVGLALVVPDLLPLAFGSKWSAAIPAAQIAVLVGPVLAVNWMCIDLLLALGRTTALVWMNASATVVLVIALFIPDEPTIETVMMAFLVRAYVTSPLFVFVAQRISRVNLIGCVIGLMPLALATLLMAGVVTAVQWAIGPDAGPVWRLAWSIFAGAGTYGVAAALAVRPLIRKAWQLARARR